jgi:hypothetical protein
LSVLLCTLFLLQLSRFRLLFLISIFVLACCCTLLLVVLVPVADAVVPVFPALCRWCLVSAKYAVQIPMLTLAIDCCYNIFGCAIPWRST